MAATSVAAPQSLAVGILHVVFAGKSEAIAKRYMREAANSCRTAAASNPQLPTALATNMLTQANITKVWTFVYSVEPDAENPWIVRFRALAASPFELTLALDSSFTICSSMLHAALMHEHKLNRLDFAFNFGGSKLLNATSSFKEGHALSNALRKPSVLEDMLPHLCAMLGRRGSGLRLLINRVTAALRMRGSRGQLLRMDDQEALQVVLIKLSRRGYQACNDHEAPEEGDYYVQKEWWHPRSDAVLRFNQTLWSTNPVAATTRVGTMAWRHVQSIARVRQGCRLLRIWRLHESIGALRPAADGYFTSLAKNTSAHAQAGREGKRFVREWPLYTRPFSGPMLALHSYNLQSTRGRDICHILNEHAPRTRLLMEATKSAPLVTPTSQKACLKASESLHGKPLLHAKVICAMLPRAQSGRSPEHLQPGLVKPLKKFWEWMDWQHLTSHYARRHR